MYNVVNPPDGKLFVIHSRRVAVVIDEGKRTTVSISRRTKDALDSMKHPGQSYDGLIQELTKFWKEEHRVEERGPAETAGQGG